MQEQQIQVIVELPSGQTLQIPLASGSNFNTLKAKISSETGQKFNSFNLVQNGIQKDGSIIVAQHQLGQPLRVTVVSKALGGLYQDIEPETRRLAFLYRNKKLICRSCGVINAAYAKKCRKCFGKKLRKKFQLVSRDDYRGWRD